MAGKHPELAKALRQVREELNRAAKDKQAENIRRQRKQPFVHRFLLRREVNSGLLACKYTPGPAQQDQKSQLDLEMVRWTRAVASYTKWLVIVGAVAACVAFFTLEAIQGQLTEMQSTGRQTDDLIKATKQAADAAKQSAETTVALERPSFFVLVKVDGTAPQGRPV